MTALATLSNAPAARQRRVADLIVEALLDSGVDTFFGVPGGAISPIYDALAQCGHGRMVVCRHETSAAFMAAGWARATGRVPALLMTSGPGITNAITGIASAFADGIPMIAIGGEVPRANFGRGALQEGSRYQLDVLGMIRSVTKAALEATSAQGTLGQLRRLIATASSGRRGPVYLSLPLDVANGQASTTRTSTVVGTSFTLDDQAISEAAGVVASARSALLMVGSGARGASAELLALAERLGHPVVTTPKAKGIFPEDHPLSLGVFGYGGSLEASGFMNEGVDVLLAIGCGLGETATNNWSPAVTARGTFIQVDIDSAQIGRNYPADIGIVGPAGAVMRALEARLPQKKSAIFARPRRMFSMEPYSASGPLRTPEVLAAIQARAPRNTFYTSDIGEHLLFALHHLRIGRGAEFFAGIGLGSMGSGIGAAIGAKYASPERGVLSICGDYGFQMYGLTELATCVQEKLGTVFLVLNDASMRMVEAGFGSVYGRVPAIQGPRVDFAAMARAAGGDGISINTRTDLASLPADLFTRDRPVVLDVAIDPTQKFGANLRNVTLSNFRSSFPPEPAKGES